MTTKVQGFQEWYYTEGHYPVAKRGSGVRKAYETGAMHALKDHYNNPYARKDCTDAYEDGYSDMIETLKSTVIVCDCCGSKIDRRRSH